MLTYSDKRQDDFSFPSANPLFFRLEILKIHDLFKLKIAKFIYNCLKKLTPTNFITWFNLTSQVHNHNTRSKFIDINNFNYKQIIYLFRLQGPLIMGLKKSRYRDPKYGMTHNHL